MLMFSGTGMARTAVAAKRAMREHGYCILVVLLVVSVCILYLEMKNEKRIEQQRRLASENKKIEYRRNY